MLAKCAINTLIKYYSFNSVVDIGSGQGLHANIFLKHGKDVTLVDYGISPYFKKAKNDFENLKFIRGDFNTIEFEEKFDLVWASHILEHQRNIGLFLDKIKNICKDDGGIISITVPPAKDNIVGGHLTIWNAGLLIYNLVLTGLDCSQISIKQEDYNISIILIKKQFDLPKNLAYDRGDIQKLSKYFPKEFNYHGFDGKIMEYNWPQ